ncbi:MAG: hypothetical protein H0U73_10815 [Tatlockia sp.]|nr:hypothetical protein [Tatlockia sp.]
MTREIEVTGDGGCLLNALSIALTINILTDKVDKYQNRPGYQQLVKLFTLHHPNFKPVHWSNLKSWLFYYRNHRDLELILAPVLLKFCQSDNQYQAQFKEKILNELTNLIRNQGNKELIMSGEFYRLDTANCPNIDALNFKDKSSILNELKTIIKTLNPNQDFINLKAEVKAKTDTVLNTTIELIKANPNAFQGGFSLGDIKHMAEALSLDVRENEEEAHFSQDKIGIRLKNKEQHWNVFCDDQDIGMIDTKYSFGKLNMTSDKAHSGEIKVLSPLKSIKADDREKKKIYPTAACSSTMFHDASKAKENVQEFDIQEPKFKHEPSSASSLSKEENNQSWEMPTWMFVSCAVLIGPGTVVLIAYALYKALMACCSTADVLEEPSTSLVY